MCGLDSDDPEQGPIVRQNYIMRIFTICTLHRVLVIKCRRMRSMVNVAYMGEIIQNVGLKT